MPSRLPGLVQAPWAAAGRAQHNGGVGGQQAPRVTAERSTGYGFFAPGKGLYADPLVLGAGLPALFVLFSGMLAVLALGAARPARQAVGAETSAVTRGRLVQLPADLNPRNSGTLKPPGWAVSGGPQ